MDTIKTVLESEKDILLKKTDLDSLREYIAQLEKQSAYAEAYRTELCEQLRKSVESRRIDLDHSMWKSIVEKLDVSELQALIKALDKASAQPCAPQLCTASADHAVGNTEFRI